MRIRKATRTRQKSPEIDRYHHGDLKAALINAADEILTEQGVEGFSLREAARRAGVSPAAPAHHFGDAAGLLSEVAMLGFSELATALDISAKKVTPVQRLRLQGLGYVSFALRYPGRFQLMFRHNLLKEEHAGLRAAAEASMEQLEKTVREIRALSADAPLDAGARSMLLAAWSIVHGFAHLVLDGKLAQIYKGTPRDALLRNVLPAMLLSQWPDDVT